MARVIAGRWCWILLVVAGVLMLVACAPAAAPQPAKPAAEPAKPAAQPAKPAAEPAKPAAQPAKPAAEPAKPAAQPAKPAAQPVVELRAGCSLAKPDAVCDALDKFADLVKDKTKGEVIVRDFGQALGVEQQLTQSVMTGSVDVGMITNGNAGRFTNAYFVYDLPFLFKNYEAGLKSLDGPSGRAQIAQLEKDLGVKYLYTMSFGAGRDIQTRNKPLRVPADLKGLKIRVVSTPVDLATMKAWGANPTPVDWAQTYTAIQQGVVDGMQGSLPPMLGGKFYEILKHNIRLDYQFNFHNTFMNLKKFESLAPQHQKAILEAAQEAKLWGRNAAVAWAKHVFEEMAKNGMTIYTPTAEEYAQWASIREKVWQEVAEQQKGKIDLNLANQIFAAQ